MNQGQEQFLDYILERVQEDKVKEARVLLVDSFNKLTGGNFTQDDIMQFIPKMMMLLKPDKIEEVQAIMMEFAGNFGN